MYALLGDPAVSLGLPGVLDAEVGEEPDGSHRWRAAKPDGATALVVGFRAQRTGSTPEPRVLDEPGVRRQLVKANAGGEFVELARHGPDEPWEGVVKGRGEIRLAAITPAGILVFTARLE